MNNELANFFIEFTSHGLSELKSEMNELKNSVDEMSDSFKESSGSGDGFFNKLKSWTTSLGGLVLGFVSVRKAITDMFNVADRTIDLHLTASRLGVNPLDIESLGRISARFGGQMSDAYSFYESMQDLSFNLGLGRYTQGQADIMALADIDIQAIKNATPTDRINHLINQLQTAFANTSDPELKSQIQAQFGNIPDAIRSIMETGDYWNLIGKGEDFSYMFTEEARKEAIENKNARLRLAEAWEKLVQEFTPAITRIIEEFVTPLVENFADFAKNKDLGQILSDWINQMKEWIQEVWPEVKRVLMGFADVLTEMLRWIFGDGSWSDVKKAGRRMMGMPEELTEAEKNVKTGKTVGAVAGATVAGLAGASPLGIIGAGLLGLFGGGKMAEYANEIRGIANLPQIDGSGNPVTNNYAGDNEITININDKPAGKVTLDKFGKPAVKMLDSNFMASISGGGAL